MTEAHSVNATGTSSSGDQSAVAALGIITWLCLAVTPTFAIMAVLTSIIAGGPMAVFCTAASGSPLTGMVLMSLLMSAFRSPPWLRLIAQHRPMYSSR